MFPTIASIAPSLRPSFRVLLAIGAGLTGPPSMHAQCAPNWQPGAAPAGTFGLIRSSTEWDPDGGGPLGRAVVFGGTFTSGQFGPSAPLVANRIVAWDPATGLWRSFGSGMNAPVHAVAVLANGMLVAGGEFTTADGVACNHLALWNGSTWLPLGQGTNDDVYALSTMPTGDLVVGGAFTAAGSTPAGRLATWNGSAWASVGGGLDDSVFALQRLPNGDLAVGGRFSTAGSSPIQSLARWDGVAWHSIGQVASANFPPLVFDLDMMPNGDLVAAGWGFFYSAPFQFAYSVGRWNGTSWSGFGADLLRAGDADTAAVMSVKPLPNGDLIVAGWFDSDGAISLENVARSNGSAWSPLGIGVDATAFTIAQTAAGDLVVGGAFARAGGSPVSSVAHWNGNAWSALGDDVGQVLFGTPQVALPIGDGRHVVAGAFSRAGAVALNNVASWDGDLWAPLGAGVDGPVAALIRMPNGDFVVGGTFQNAGGAPAANIARWNGTSWAPLGAGVSGFSSGVTVKALAVLPNGDLVAAGDFNNAGGLPAPGIARWSGSAWTAYPALPVSSPIPFSLLATPNGDLYVGCRSFFLPGSVQRWSGAGWQQLGTLPGCSSAEDLALAPNGDLIAGGQGGVLRWNGSTWAPTGLLTDGVVSSLEVLPDGDVVAVGTFSQIGGTAASGIARFDGSSWLPFEEGLNGYLQPWALHVVGPSDNTLLVCGRFTSAGGKPAHKLARLAAPCPASAVSIPTLCTGPAGPTTLTADGLSYVGGSLRTTTNGLAPGSLAIAVVGLSSPNLALPAGPIGSLPCRLLASPEIVALVVPSLGTVRYDLAIPDIVALIGLPVFHQVLQLNSTISAVSLSSSNAMAFVLGSF